MKLPLSLIKSFIHLNLDLPEIEKTLTELGIEVDATHDIPPEADLPADVVLEISLTPQPRPLHERSWHCPRTVRRPAVTANRDKTFPPRAKREAHRKACSRFCGRCDLLPSIHGSSHRARKGRDPPPLWMQRQLIAAGFRTVNNIVDATNYILLRTGQPLHAFDLDKIEGKTVHVGLCKKAEPFTALTGQELEIPVGAIVISDAKKTDRSGWRYGRRK